MKPTPRTISRAVFDIVSRAAHAIRPADVTTMTIAAAWMTVPMAPAHASKPPPALVATDGVRTHTWEQGIAVVEIAPANSAGVSYNRYTAFNVGPSGLVFNNVAALGADGKPVSPESLRGYVDRVNPRLTRAAGLIVNEVISAERSRLDGPVEVRGDKADLVIANPNGITCVECSFKGSDRVTLATGPTYWAGDGKLGGFEVTGGDIVVEGTDKTLGLDGSRQTAVYLLAEQIRLNGEVVGGIEPKRAGDLGLIAGAHRFNYQSRQSHSIGRSGPPRGFAIDSRALGAMRANRIFLVSGDSGLGVRLGADVMAKKMIRVSVPRATLALAPDVVMASEDVGVDVDKATLAPGAAWISKGAMTVAAGTLHLEAGSGRDYAGPEELRRAKGMAPERPRMSAALLMSQGSTTPGKSMSRVEVRNRFENAGLVHSGGELTLRAPHVVNHRTAAIVADRLQLHANAGYLNLRIPEGAVEGGGALTNHGVIYAHDTLRAVANGLFTNHGLIHGGQERRGGVSLRANTIVNRGVISGQDVRLAAGQIRNEVSEGDTRNWFTFEHETVKDGAEHYLWHGPTNTYRYYQNYKAQVLEWQEYRPGKRSVSPKILADNYLSLSFTDLRNIGGVIWSGGRIVAQGFTTTSDNTGRVHRSRGIYDDVGNRFVLHGGKLTNDTLALETRMSWRHTTKTRRDYWISWGITRTEMVWAPCGESYGVFDNMCAHQGDVMKTVNKKFEDGYSAGIRAARITGDGFSITNRGAKTATLDDVLEPASEQPGAPARRPGDEDGVWLHPGLRWMDDFRVLVAFDLEKAATTSKRSRSIPAIPVPPLPPLQPLPPLPPKGPAVGDSGQSPVDPSGGGGNNVPGEEENQGPVTPRPGHGSGRAPDGPGTDVTGQGGSSSPIGNSLDGTATPPAPTGSGHLISGLGLDPAKGVSRVGGARSEQFLVRQQMAELTGRAVLPEYKNADEQMRALMDNALRDAQRLRLVHGEALTAAQKRGLAGDIVWMVRMEMNGDTVLAPVVYLSAATRTRARASAAIEADTIDLDTDAVHNEDGVISGTTSVTLRAKGSIVSRSGEIRGGTVALRADKDIEVAGGTIVSDGDATLSAGGRLRMDTTSRRDTTATTTGAAGAYSTTMRTHTVEETRHTRPSLRVGGDLRATSGTETSLAGAQVAVRGNADLHSDGDLRIVGRTDQTVARTASHESGYGINGALFDATDSVGETVSGTHVGSMIEVGGHAGMRAKGTLTLQGANVKAGGDAEIRARSVEVMAAPNVSTSAVTVDRRSTLRINGTAYARANGSAGSGAGTGAGIGAGMGRGDWLGANAAANAGAEGTLELFRDSTRTETSRTIVHQGSAIEAGGALRVRAGNDVHIAGSRLAAGGDMRLDARNVSAVAAQDVTANTWSSRDGGFGYYASGSAGAQAGIGAAVSGDQPGGLPAAHVNAEAGWQWRDARQQGTEGGATAVTSSLTAGGDLVRHADDTLRDVGTAVSSGGNLTQSAATIVSEAARDTTYRTATSGDRSARVSGYASASAGLPAAVEPGQSASTLSSGVGAGAGLKIDYRQSSAHDVATTETAVVSSMRAGGDVSTASSGETRLEGTQIEATGAIDMRAASVRHVAAYDTHADAQTSAGTGAAVQIDLAGPGVGVSGDHAAANAHDNRRSAQAGRMRAGGDVSVRTTGDATLEGTTIEGGAVSIAAGGDLAFQAARATRDTSDASTAANGGVSVGAQSFGVSAGVNVSRASAREARDEAGSVVARDGAIDIASGGDARFAGTSLSGATDVRIAAGGDVTLDVARERESRDASQFNASADVGHVGHVGRVKTGAGASTGVGSPGAFVGHSTYAREQETGVRIRGGSVHVASGGDTTLIGTTVDADQVDYATGGVRREVAAAPEKITASVVNVGLPPVIRPARGHRRPGQAAHHDKADYDGRVAFAPGNTPTADRAAQRIAERHPAQTLAARGQPGGESAGDRDQSARHDKADYDGRVAFAPGNTPTADRAARRIAEKHPGPPGQTLAARGQPAPPRQTLAEDRQPATLGQSLAGGGQPAAPGQPLIARGQPDGESAGDRDQSARHDKAGYDGRVVFALGDDPAVDRAARRVARKHPGTHVVRVAASEGDRGVEPDPVPPDGLRGRVKFTMVGHGDATRGTLGGLSPERLADMADTGMRANPDATLGKLNLLGCDSACLTARTSAALAARQPHAATRVTGETGDVKVLADGKKKTLAMNAEDPDALGGTTPTVPVHHHRLYDESQLMPADKAREDWETMQQRMIAQPRPQFDMRERGQLERLAVDARPEGDRPVTALLETVAKLPDHPGPVYGAYRMPRGVLGRTVREGDTVGGVAIQAMASRGYAQQSLLHHGHTPDRQSVLMVFDGPPAKSLAPFSPYQGTNARTEVYYPPDTRMTVRDILDTPHGTYVWLDKAAAGTSTGTARHLTTGEPFPDYDHRVVMPLDDSGKVMDAARSLRHKHAATTFVSWPETGGAARLGDTAGVGGRHKYSLVGEWRADTRTLSGRRVSALADAVAPLAANASGCKVSLVGCHSAALAAPLRDALRERGVAAEVTGREGRVRVSDSGRKHTVRHDDSEALGGPEVPRRKRQTVSYNPAGAERAERADRSGTVARPRRAARLAAGPRRMFDEMKQSMTAYAAQNEREVVRQRAVDDARMRVSPRVFVNRDAYDPVAIFARLPDAYNDSLRGAGTGPVTRDVHALAAALHALPPTPGVSYFATRTPVLAYDRLVRTGDIMTADIFLSTDMALPDARAALDRREVNAASATGATGAGMPTLIRIEGHSGRNTTPFHGEASPSLVYAPGTRFEVRAMENDGGVRYVLMKEVSSAAPATARLRPGRPAMERDLLTGHRKTAPDMAEAIAAIAPAPHFDAPPPLPDSGAETRATRFAPLARRFSDAERQYERAMMLPLLQGAALPSASGAPRGGLQPSRADRLALRDFPGASYRGGVGAPGLYGRTIVEGDVVRTAKPLMHSALLADADRASSMAGAGGLRPYLFAVEGPAGRQLDMPRADGGRFGPEVVFPARSEFSIAAIRETPARTLIWARPYFGASSEPLKDMYTGQTLDRR